MHFKQLLFLFLCSLSMTAVADDYKIYSDDVCATKGTNTSVLNVFMTNEETISALQFDISLPVGVDVYFGENEDEDMVYFISKGERAKTDHTASYSKLAERKYRVMVSSPTNATFKETTANKTKPVAVITLEVATDAQCGIQNVEISNVVLSHYDAETRVTQPYYPDNSVSTIAVKPASGAEINETDGILSIATAEGTKLDAASYNTLTSGKSDAVIDLRASEIADGVTASDIQSAGASLYYLPSESVIEGENIIANGVCSKLIVQDGKDLVIPSGFTAEQAVYTRSLSYEYGTICLPFALESGASVQFYKLASVSETTMTFEAIDVLEAGEPALFKNLSGNTLSIDVANTTVVASEVGKVTASGWTMQGTYTKEVFDAEDNVYAVSAGKLYHNTGMLTMNPFRAYFTGSTSGVPMNISIDGTTVIGSVENSELTIDGATYNLAGQKVGKGYKGIVITNGRKEIRK